MPIPEEAMQRLADFATYDFDAFKGIVADLMGLYENGKMRVILAGPATKSEIEDTDAKIIQKKREIDENTFSRIVDDAVWCMHCVLTGEVSALSEDLKKSKDTKTADGFIAKAKVIEEVIDRHPTIRMGFGAYTLSRTGFLDDIDWVAELKVFHSPSAYMPEPHSAVPVGRLNLSVAKLKPPRVETESVEFEVTSSDLKFMIKSLQDLQQAMLNLESKKLVEK